MFRFFLFICLIFPGFSAFGEKTAEQNNIIPMEKTRTTEEETSDPAMEIKVPDSPKETGQNPIESSAFPETLKKHRESLFLEWAGGLGITTEATAFFMPLTLEIQGLMLKQGHEELRWLFQGGGILMGRVRFRTIKDTGLTYILQTGLKYQFFKTLYGSVKGGAIQALKTDRIWTVGLFFGSAINSFKFETGIQVFYPDEGEVDFGVIVSMGSTIKKW